MNVNEYSIRNQAGTRLLTKPRKMGRVGAHPLNARSRARENQTPVMPANSVGGPQRHISLARSV